MDKAQGACDRNNHVIFAALEGKIAFVLAENIEKQNMSIESTLLVALCRALVTTSNGL